VDIFPITLYSVLFPVLLVYISFITQESCVDHIFHLGVWHCICLCAHSP